MAKRPKPERHSEPLKHLWIDIGVRVKVPMTTPQEDHHALVADVLTTVTIIVKQALADYQKNHKKVPVEFDIT